MLRIITKDIKIDDFALRQTIKQTLERSNIKVQMMTRIENNTYIYSFSPTENKVFYSLTKNKVISKEGKELKTNRIRMDQANKIIEMFQTLKQLGVTFSGEIYTILLSITHFHFKLF